MKKNDNYPKTDMTARQTQKKADKSLTLVPNEQYYGDISN